MKKILVTGGCGYIGTHTIVDLIESGYDVISADNLSRSNPAVLDGVQKITGKKIKNYNVDLCHFEDTCAVFQENTDIAGIIHFAAYKAVGESVENPLLYYSNNLNSLINILRCANEFKVANFVFSSSCTVYGNPDVIPVTEESPLKKAASPYGSTKQISEDIVQQALQAGADIKAVLLRYFNPAGAHPSCEIGELPVGKPQNLVPAITQTAVGKLPQMNVWGNDYDTRDGSCLRDYIHVCDIARAHTLALQRLEKGEAASACEVFNLGSGTGTTVLEMINTFEAVSGTKLDYKIGPKRAGDAVAIYANNDKARHLLGWSLRYDVNDIMRTAWQWENRLKNEKKLFNPSNADLN